ncbi:PSME3-interacting protein isoform X2 [Aethina tumida]|uniref:PSME3-interacting protein isoform X2 n=1 Tax=Aethina tumida TaxID=116153 RepID=UPI0021477791|nr:PSME3-interacting protein isoform X2 [Aethina tumida]
MTFTTGVKNSLDMSSMEALLAKRKINLTSSSGFITETEAAATRQRRQQEWERVRKATDPLKRPEDSDGRSLYQKLQDQKRKREFEFYESRRLKNMIKGLDDDEIEFLDLVDRSKMEADRKKELEEEQELNDYRNRVAILHEKNFVDRLKPKVVATERKSLSNRASQQKLLRGAVVKRKVEEPEPKAKMPKIDKEIKKRNDEPGDCVLPGLGDYLDTSSGEETS